MSPKSTGLPGGHRAGFGVGVFVVFGVVVVFIVAVVGGLILYGREALSAPHPTHGATVAIDVRAGESLGAVTDDLATHGIIRSSFWFGLYARYRGLGAQLHPGRFLVDDGMVASYLAVKLAGPPDIRTRRIAFAEGLTMAQTADRVAAAGLGISREQYLAEAQHGSFTEPFAAERPPGSPLEGLLFPDTYDVPEHATAHDVIALQLSTFAAKAVPQLHPAGQLNRYQTLILASLIEREARFDNDRPLVAAVIINRLKTGTNLDIDAAVLYGLGLNGRSPTAAELARDTPYNTYLHAGLPPTPIANPGVAAIAAASAPAATAYGYYVSDDCGHNHYSVTVAEHYQQVATYIGTGRC